MSQAAGCFPMILPPAACSPVDRSRGITRGILAALVLAGACESACAHYRAKPIAPETAEAELALPSQPRLTAMAQSLHHPLIAPVTLALDKPWTPDQVAVLAVILNPALRAARDQRQAAAAQVLQAGILPNPQLSPSIDLPVGGDTEHTTNGFGIGLSWEFTALITRSAKR